MKALVTCEQSEALDLATRETLALSALQLMEKASLRLWDALRDRLARHAEIAAKGKTLKIIALCGKGDNGGDALAIIRHAFCAGYQCLEAVVSAREPGECAKKQAESLAAAGIRIVKWKGAEDKAVVSMLANADIVLDGILGTGLSDAATNEAKEMIRMPSRHPAFSSRTDCGVHRSTFWIGRRMEGRISMRARRHYSLPGAGKGSLLFATGQNPLRRSCHRDRHISRKPFPRYAYDLAHRSA